MRRNANKLFHGKPTGPSPLSCSSSQARAFMLLEGANVGIHEKVRIDQNHLKDSLSATARISATLSTFAALHKPSSTERVRYSPRFLAGAIMRFMPSRRASLTSALNLTPRCLPKRLSDAATSPSRVIVVRMHQSIMSLMHWMQMLATQRPACKRFHCHTEPAQQCRRVQVVQIFASRIKLNGVALALLNSPKPAFLKTFARRASPA